MKYQCSGIILAGGRSSRFSGKNKALIPIAGQTILDRLYCLFATLFDDIVLVSNDPLQYISRDITIATDLYPVRSSMTGIHAGLSAMRHPYGFFTACDTPFLKPETVTAVLDRIERQFDVIVPETSAGLEPLCAAYSRRCMEPMGRNITEEKLKLSRLFEKLRVRKVPEPVIAGNDPDFVSFFNINTPEDLARAEQFVTAGPAS